MTEPEIAAAVGRFHEDGYLVIEDAIAKADVSSILYEVQKAFDEPCADVDVYGADLAKIWRPRMFERSHVLENLVDNPRLVPLIRAVLGRDCHLIAMSALRTGPEEGISTWHADETVRFPRPKGVPLDPRIPMPCFVINLNYYLCDVDEPLGPTQLVPGSHRSGRQPEPADFGPNGLPSYEGRTAFSAVGPAGTAVLWNDQAWHRGAPNRTSDRIRWVQQAPYGRRFIAQRFYPFVNYTMPEGIFERANPERRELLGLHRAGAYG